MLIAIFAFANERTPSRVAPHAKRLSQLRLMLGCDFAFHSHLGEAACGPSFARLNWQARATQKSDSLLYELWINRRRQRGKIGLLDFARISIQCANKKSHVTTR